MGYNINNLKKEFPVLKRIINGEALVYLDNAATTQMPRAVIDAILDFDSNHRANVHRGVHTLSDESTLIYEEARKTVARFINAIVSDEIVFVRNTTEAINLVAYAWGLKHITKGDVILTTEIEHHSNLIPWQRLCQAKKANLEFFKTDKTGKIIFDDSNINWNKVRLVAFTHVSNVLGIKQDVESIVKYILKKTKQNEKPVRILLDSAQAIPHMKINASKLGVDFIVFSGHKMYGPMGIGVLWINREIFDEMDVFLTGGGMINEVELKTSTYAAIPEKLEAGTPNVSGAAGLSAACKFIDQVGYAQIHSYETDLLEYAYKKITNIKDVETYGPVNLSDRSSLIAFNIAGIPAHDIAAILDTKGIAVRSGQHCVMPWHINQQIKTTVRASFGLYNNQKDVDKLIEALKRAKVIFGV